MRSRRDRERIECPTCGKQVTVTRSGRLMAHVNADRKTCVDAAWKARRDA